MWDTDNFDKVVEELYGTLNTLADVCDEHGIDEDDLTVNDYNFLENEIFLCTICNWWYGVGEEGDDYDNGNTCESCVV